MMGGYGNKLRKKAEGGLGIGSPYIYDDSTGRYTLYATEEAAEKAAKGKRGVRVGDSLDADDYKIYKSQGAAKPKNEKTPGTKKTYTGPNSSAKVKSAGRKVSRKPKEGDFYLKDKNGNFVFYPKGTKDASMRTAAERMLPGGDGKVSQGTVDDLFMEERPDQMKKMKTKEAPKAKTNERGLKDMGIQKSKEVTFDGPSKPKAKAKATATAKPKADGSKSVVKSKADAIKARQDKKTQKVTDRVAKSNVRKNTRKEIQDVREEGRQARKAIRRGTAQSGMRDRRR